MEGRGVGLIIAAIFVTFWLPYAARREILRNVRDNPALLSLVTLDFDDAGLQPPHGAPGAFLPSETWLGAIRKDADWFYLRWTMPSEPDSSVEI